MLATVVAGVDAGLGFGVVVVAGKGHETIQIVGAERRAFDDREVARNALVDLGFRGGQRAHA